MALNRLSDALVVEGSIEEVTKCEKKMEEAFEKFKMACEDDLDERAAYFRETESRFIAIKERISLFIESNIQRYTLRSLVTPEDSVSEVDSHKTTRTRSSCTSRERSSNAKLKAATKKATLIADDFSRKIQTEENGIRLEQGKKTLQLRTEIAEVEAEERACIGFTSPYQRQEERRTGFVTHQDQLDLICKCGVNVPDPVFVG